MKRDEHTFKFDAAQIRDAAAAEADYHEVRTLHWQERADRALEQVKATIGARVVEREVTGGTVAAVEVEYGDPEAWREYQLATTKVRTHRERAERYRTDERVYGSQGEDGALYAMYELDVDDVHHFRLGGEARDE